MIEQITQMNIRKYESYLASLKLSDDLAYLGMDYGGTAVGTCSLRINGFILYVDELHMDACYLEQIIEDLLRYLSYEAWNRDLQIIEIYTADEAEKRIFQEYGFHFDTAAVSYQCSLEELLEKTKVKQIFTLNNSRFHDIEVFDFEHPFAKRIPEHLRWILDDPTVWKQASYLVWDHNEVSSMCVVARDHIEGKNYCRLAYVYAEHPMKLAAVLNASLQAVLQAQKETESADNEMMETQFTFAAVNQKSITLAKGLGFEEAELRSRCERGRILLYELMDAMNLKEALL